MPYFTSAIGETVNESSTGSINSDFSDYFGFFIDDFSGLEKDGLAALLGNLRLRTVLEFPGR